VTHRRLRKALVGGGVLVALSSATTLSLASQRIAGEQAAFRAPAAERCTPTELNRSAVLPGSSLSVSPLPDSYDASPYTQISLLGAPISAISSISVHGSKTGSHSGHLRGYSQGDGASFVPSRPFRPGEMVTVRGEVREGSREQRFAFHFVVSTPDNLPYVAPTPPSGRDPLEVQHFRSRPDLNPPVIEVTTRTPQSNPEYIFAAPYSGPGPAGPMIFDEAGNLVWFAPLPANTVATNLQVQQYQGQPVLTWWQGYIPPQGFGEGEEVIDDSSYQPIDRVHAGNGYKADLHDFHITLQGTAVLTVFSPIDCNLSSLGGPSGGAVTDSIFQEIDLATGLVRREWHSLDHVALAESFSPAVSTSTEWPFDYFHLNSIDQLANGTTLISARNTWALYELNTQTGQVLTRIGGRHSDVKLAPGAATAFQHDATVLPNGDISIFDNGGVPKVHPQSRGMVVAIDDQTKTDNVVAQYEHPGALSSASQGSVQMLANGNVFIGWGQEPFFSQFSAGGQLQFDAHMHGTYQSYRAYRFPWTGTAPGAPAIASSPAPGATGSVTVYASWNGDTRTASWRVLAGPSAQELTPVAVAPRAGFETAISTPGPASFVAVRALSASGAVLGSSRTISG
jgi:Arylsulfotransferase (ASST)